MNDGQINRDVAESLKNTISELNRLIETLEALLVSMNVKDSPAGQLNQSFRSSGILIDTRAPAAQHLIALRRPLNGLSRAVLYALAQLEQSNALRMHPTLIAALSGCLPSDKTFTESLEKLLAQELIVRGSGSISLTDRGRSLIMSTVDRVTTNELVDKVASQLSKNDAGIFQALFAANGKSLSRQELSEILGLSEAMIQKRITSLLKLHLVEKAPNDRYVSAELLFIE